MMNQTVIVDEAERDRRFENRLNAVVRHCKIGNVVEKQRRMPVTLPMIAPWAPSEPFTWPSVFRFPEMTPSKCSCKPGQSCGNAACPHLLIATC